MWCFVADDHCRSVRRRSPASAPPPISPLWSSCMIPKLSARSCMTICTGMVSFRCRACWSGFLPLGQTSTTRAHHSCLPLPSFPFAALLMPIDSIHGSSFPHYPPSVVELPADPRRQALFPRPQDPHHAAPFPSYGISQALYPRFLQLHHQVSRSLLAFRLYTTDISDTSPITNSKSR